MEPLRVVCQIQGQIVLPTGSIAIDALLGAAYARVHRSPPVVSGQPIDPLPIPIARSECGRIYLASFAYASYDGYETRYRNRRFPAREALRLTAMKRVDVAAGAQKSYRIPYSASHITGDQLEWWCAGEADGIRTLLATVTNLGRHRGVDYGRVVRWAVTPVADPWPGFPVLRDGRPLRPLPLDWPGLVDYQTSFKALLPPYWDRTREVKCAVPQC
jgi:CRISPR type IV-associated protein Csf3